MNNKMRTRLAAAAAVFPLALAGATASLTAAPAAAQPRPIVGVADIHALAVQSDGGLGAGATLQFEMRATPGAQSASVALGGTSIVVPLREVSTGLYRGSYTVRRADNLDARSQLTARLAHGDRGITRVFPWPASLHAGPAPVIERFVVRPMGRIQPGQELRFRLEGARGGEAWVDIPGVVSGLRLSETRSGVYEGSYTVRRRDDRDAFAGAVATLRMPDNQRATARLGREGSPRDASPPEIAGVVPAHGERVSERGRVQIAARYSDAGSGVDPDSVQLRLNGRDVTRDARLTADEVQYRADLPPGRYRVELQVRDRAGNAAQQAWLFEVVERSQAGPPVPLPLPLEVSSPASGASLNLNASVLLHGRTAPHATVRVQVAGVLGVAGAAGFSQALMDQTVQADANGNFQIALPPRPVVPPVGHYDVRLTATGGGQRTEQSITLYHQG